MYSPDVHRPDLTRRRHPARLLPALGAAALLALAGCSESAHPRGAATTLPPAAPRGSAGRGDISVTGAYIPQPASPDVAAAYFTLRDAGSSADTLLSATTDPASTTALMRETDTGGSGSMTDLPGGIAVPAHGSVTLAPGGLHLMLTDPRTKLTAGQHVAVTLRLAHAGTVRVVVPVTSLLSDADTGAGGADPLPSTPSQSSMPSMPGM